MSRRSLLYRARYARLKLGEAVDRILTHHREARDTHGKVCSLPMRTEKAHRLALTIGCVR